MDERSAIEALAGLAQEHRLRVFRLLAREAPDGLPAGQIAERLGIPASTMSSHLAQLERAGLLRSRRDQRRIIYAVEVEGIRRLLTFLIEDCCRGHPEICGFGLGGGRRDDHDLPQPGLQNVAQRPGDDPERRPSAEDHRIPEDTAEPQ
jgi:ArsR family transcriptional regulator, arsenate/arsenite/antimonite-responsive transcriptional repressor